MTIVDTDAVLQPFTSFRRKFRVSLVSLLISTTLIIIIIIIITIIIIINNNNIYTG